MIDLDLNEIVRDAISGDQSAWDRIVERFAGVVWAVARGQGLDPADASDVSQTVWLRLAEHIASLREPERIGGWLSVTTRHEALRVRRRRQFQMPVSDDRLSDLADYELPLPEAGVVAEEESATLWSAFAHLGEGCQTLLRMLIADPPASYQVVSETLGLPIGSIGPKRSRCLSSLRGHVTQAIEHPVRVGGPIK